jgi:hypothetical protein
MMKIIKNATFTAAVLLVAALAMSTFATSAYAAGNPYEQQILKARYDAIKANVDFHTGVMADTCELVSNASPVLTPHIEKLNADLVTLNSYVQSSDKGAFNAFVESTIRTDLKAAGDAIKEVRSHFREWGVTYETRAMLLEKYQERKAAFEQAMSQVKIDLGNIRLSHYNDAMAKTDERMGKLSGKGVDVSGMQGIKSGAIANVISPLQSAVNSGDGNAVMNELKQKCLFNGAPYSFHYAAKIDLEALKAITKKIEPAATEAGYGGKISEINAKLNSAEKTLEKVGTNPYTDQEKENVWSDLQKASEVLRELIKSMNGDKQG